MKKHELVYVPVSMEECINGGGVSATIHYHDDVRAWFKVKVDSYIFDETELEDMLNKMINEIGDELEFEADVYMKRIARDKIAKILYGE